VAENRVQLDVPRTEAAAAQRFATDARRAELPCEGERE